MKNNQQLFTEIIGKLAEFGITSPEAEARMIFEKVFKRDFRDLLLDKFVVSDEDIAEIEAILARRSTCEPIQYILGVAPFYNYELNVDKHVLIPRPETEILVEYLIKNIPQNGKLLDIGCGSGTIGVTVAYERPDVEVMAVDISLEALRVAESNSDKYQLTNVRFCQSNLFEHVEGKFDFIAANLPYIPEIEYLECAKEVRDYEPKLALVADDDGLKLIFQTADKAAEFLQPNGQIIFENGYNQAEKIVNYLQKSGDFSEISILNDYNNYQRFTLAKL